MALNWNIEDIENHKEKCWNESLHRINPVTDALIWLCLIVGISAIRDNTWEEFFVRVWMWERTRGSMLGEDETGEKQPQYITVENVQDHIGLSTNASPRTKAQFDKHLTRSMRDDALRVLKESGR